MSDALKLNTALVLSVTSVAMNIGNFVYTRNSLYKIAAEIEKVDKYVKRVEEGVAGMDAKIDDKINTRASEAAKKIRETNNVLDNLRKLVAETVALQEAQYDSLLTVVGDEEKRELNKAFRKRSGSTAQTSNHSIKPALKKQVKIVEETEDENTEEHDDEEQPVPTTTKRRLPAVGRSKEPTLSEDDDEDADRRRLAEARARRRSELQQ